MSPPVGRVKRVALWTVTVFMGVASGAPGLAKLLTSGEWDRLFQMAAFGLAWVMLGAIATPLAHPGSHLFRGRQAPMSTTEPPVWFVLLVIVGITRWRQSHPSADSRAVEPIAVQFSR